jgi:hypothetical protein
VQTIEELRLQADSTEVSLSIQGLDTLYAATDGRLCLADGLKILIEGLPEAKPGMMVAGTLNGTKKRAEEGYPLLSIEAAKSIYELYGNEDDKMVIDIDSYEKSLSGQQGQQPGELPVTLPEDGIEGLPTVTSIRDFRQLPVGTEARLRFQRDTVLFVSGGDAYVRGNAAVCFRNMNIGLKEGMVLWGTVIGIRDEADGMPLLSPSENTSDRYFVYDIIPDYEDHFLSFDDIDEQEVSDVVTVVDVTIDSLDNAAGEKSLYACKDGKRMPITDQYGICKTPLSVPASCKQMKAILATDGISMRLIPVQDMSLSAISLGIDMVGAPMANASQIRDLQGRRLTGTPQRGVYIKEGKKYVAK